MITDVFNSIQRKTEIYSRQPMECFIMEAPEMGLVETVFSQLYFRTGVEETIPSTRDSVGQLNRMLEEM